MTGEDRFLLGSAISTLALIALKLSGLVAWSWVWVLLPLWGPTAMTAGGALLLGVTYLVLYFLAFPYQMVQGVFLRVRGMNTVPERED